MNGPVALNPVSLLKMGDEDPGTYNKICGVFTVSETVHESLLDDDLLSVLGLMNEEEEGNVIPDSKNLNGRVTDLQSLSNSSTGEKSNKLKRPRSSPNSSVVPNSMNSNKTPRRSTKRNKKKETLAIQNAATNTELASKYANFYASALNNDPHNFQSHFEKICGPNVEVELNICCLVTSTAKNYFGNFQTCTLDAKHFIQLAQNMQVLAPDCMMTIVTCNACEVQDEIVYMATFQFAGTFICEDLNIITVDETGKTTVTDAEMKVIQQGNVKVSTTFKAIGSLTLRRKKNEKIRRLEFFYEFVQ